MTPENGMHLSNRKGFVHLAQSGLFNKRGEDKTRIVEFRDKVLRNESFRKMRWITDGRAIFNVTDQICVARNKIAFD